MVASGFLLVMSGVGIGVWTGSVLGWRRMIGSHSAPLRPVLVLAGPYQFVRHPRSFAILLVSFGAALLGEPLPVWLCASVSVGAVLAAIWRDRRLLTRLGEPYERYRKAVPFLIPMRPRRG
jgi:protein-S-isoprenylcysteine O-methyltransferase Ste14